MRIFERRQSPDDAKLATQRFVTYCLILIFTGVTAYVFHDGQPAERSTMMQTVINFTLIAVGFWLGSSKGSADKDASMSRIAEAATPAAPAIPAKVDEVKIQADVANVTEAPQPPKGTP